MALQVRFVCPQPAGEAWLLGTRFQPPPRRQRHELFAGQLQPGQLASHDSPV